MKQVTNILDVVGLIFLTQEYYPQVIFH
jgi:hypothetical protein